MLAREAFKIRSPDLRDPESGAKSRDENPKSPKSKIFNQNHEIRVCLAPPGAKIASPTPWNH